MCSSSLCLSLCVSTATFRGRHMIQMHGHNRFMRCYTLIRCVETETAEGIPLLSSNFPAMRRVINVLLQSQNNLYVF